MSNLVDLWGLRWVETPKGLDCLDLAGTNARLIHLDDWQFTFEVYSPTRGATPLEALEARLGPPIQVLGVTYYPMPQVDSFKQYLPDPSGNNIRLELNTDTHLWRVVWDSNPFEQPDQAILDYLSREYEARQVDLEMILQELRRWRQATKAFKTHR